jgi:hypothetical protein
LFRAGDVAQVVKCLPSPACPNKDLNSTPRNSKRKEEEEEEMKEEEKEMKEEKKEKSYYSKNGIEPGIVVHACSPRYSGG